ncbi:MAG TPA: hypothetical protein VFC46_00405 [Humisphaera sp.]|nr:hypothetical protein [Humisphaera sp.]
MPTPAATAPSQPAPASQTPSRRAIPGKPDLARSRGLLKEAFAKQLKDRSSAGRRKLAQALLDEVPKAADNPTDQYVLLGGAIEASKDAAILPLCFQAADMMASQYEVDALNVKTEAALKMNLRSDSPATAAENVTAALELIDPLLDAEDFSTAARILALARAGATGDPSLASIVQKRIQVVETLRTTHDRFAQQFQKLKTSPHDPAANLAVGSYLCFNKGEWEKGLPMLAKGSDANLKQLAELEISRPTSTEDVIRLGDHWWDYGSKQPDNVRVSVDRHAASLYKTALEGATGLKRTLLESRIADACVQLTIEGGLSSNLLKDHWERDLEIPGGLNDLKGDSVEIVDGKKSVVIKNPSSGEGMNTRMRQIVGIKRHTTYLLSGDIKANGIADVQHGRGSGGPVENFGAMICIDNSTSPYLDSKLSGITHAEVVEGTCDWKHVSVKFDSGEKTSIKVLLTVGGRWHPVKGLAAFANVKLIETK